MYRYCPQIGCLGKYAPHPALRATFPLWGKALLFVHLNKNFIVSLYIPTVLTVFPQACISYNNVVSFWYL